MSKEKFNVENTIDEMYESGILDAAIKKTAALYLKDIFETGSAMMYCTVDSELKINFDMCGRGIPFHSITLESEFDSVKEAMKEDGENSTLLEFAEALRELSEKVVSYANE